MEKRATDISWVSLWRVLFFVVLVSILYLGREIILGLFLAIIISSGLEGIVNIVEKTGLPRSVSVILVFLVIVLFIFFIVYSLTPFIIVQINAVLSASGKAPPVGGLGTLVTLKISQSISALVSTWSGNFLSGTASPFNFLTNAVGSVGLAVAVVLCSFYLTLGKDGVERFIDVVIPHTYEEAVLRVYERSRKLISSWLRTQIMMSIIMGFTVWGGLTLLHVPYAFLIAVLATIFELVPFVGPFLSGAVAVLSAFSVSITLAVYTLIFFIIAQQFESNILVPVLSQRIVGLHPVIVIVALLIGAEVGGILGIIIAVPAAGVFQEVIQEWSTKKQRIAAI